MASFSGNAMCTSFKQQLLLGCHDFANGTGDTFKLALYTDAAGSPAISLNADTTAYSTNTEVPNSGSYSAGGGTLTNVTPTSSSTTAFTDFSPDLQFTTATISARGALIYNTTPNTTSSGALTNPAVVVLDFGSVRTSTSGTFTIQFPVAAAATAIIRIA